MIYEWMSSMFGAEEAQDLNIGLIAESLSELSVRTAWLEMVLGMIQQINMDVDNRLLKQDKKDITDLCARRKAIQDVLEAVLSARRVVLGQAPRHNPRPAVVDLDHVTA